MTAVGPSGLMAAEMAEQPGILEQLLACRADLRDSLAQTIPRELRGVAFVGRGSSANAALYGRPLAELACRRPALLVSPSMDRLYGLRTDYRGYLAVGLSQSGRTPEVVSTIARLRSSGAVTVALTADAGSPLAGVADVTVDLRVGTERAVPTTKAFTAQLAVLIVLAEALGGPVLPDAGWRTAARAVSTVIGDRATAEAVARRLSGNTHLSVAASGLFLALAAEIALKLQETALVAASAHSSASYRHGPLALSGPAHPLLVVVGPGPAGQETTTLAHDVAALGSPVTAISVDGELPVPAGLPEPLAAFPALVRGQQLALALALERGLDPDRPRGLSKVTVT